MYMEYIMLENLFSSKARIEILKLFLFNPEKRYYQRQIATLTNQSIRGVQREVEKLKKIGLIEESLEGNRKYYKTNKSCPVFEDLKKIFFKTVGLGEVLKNDLKKCNAIKIAFIYGSYARGEENLLSDIDLLVIGNIKSRELSNILAKPKRELGREINYTVYSAPEYRKRIMKRDHFVNAVLKKEKIFIIGDEDELEKIIKSR